MSESELIKLEPGVHVEATCMPRPDCCHAHVAETVLRVGDEIHIADERGREHHAHPRHVSIITQPGGHHVGIDNAEQAQLRRKLPSNGGGLRDDLSPST
jgi:hypothetical protein